MNTSAVLFKDSRIQDVAVTGIKDAKDGSEKPWAFIVLHNNEERNDETIKSILDAANKQTAGYKKIDGVTWLDALPKR